MSDPLGDIVRRLARLEVMAQLRPDRAANFLTAYTPEYYGGTSAGVTTYATDGQLGAYVILGPMCLFTARLEWTAVTGTGEARVSLPTTAAAYNHAVIVVPSAITYSQDYLVGQIIASTNYVNFRSPITNSSSTVVNIEAAGVLTISGLFAIA